MLGDTEKHLFWDDIEGTLRRAVFLLEKAGQANLSSKIQEDHGDHREAIGKAVDHLRPCYDKLAWLLEPMWENYPSQLKSINQMILVLMESSMVIGSSMIWSDVTNDIFKRANRRDQATSAQAGNSAKAQNRRIPMREAIEQICNGLQLKATRKFADSIRPDLLKKMGVKPTTRGYSSKTIQTVIQTILEERRKSLIHS